MTVGSYTSVKERRAFSERNKHNAGLESFDKFDTQVWKGVRDGISWLDRCVSRPPLSKCANPGAGEFETSRWVADGDYDRISEIVSAFRDEYADRAKRPISVAPGRKIRRDAALERDDESGEFRSRPWWAVLDEFLRWFVSYENSKLEMQNPDGDVLKSDMVTSFHERYMNRYYARIKALGRQLVGYFACNECDEHYCTDPDEHRVSWVPGNYDDPHTVMLTFTESVRNLFDSWRCPGDHIREIQDNAFKGAVKREFYRVLNSAVGSENWEYATVVEPHKSGYGHFHVAVFVDGDVDASLFDSVMSKYVDENSSAGTEAHFGGSGSVSVNECANTADKVDNDEYLSNLGSYICEYIGGYGESLLDRSLNQLAFFAVCWATNTRRVRFSQGANELIRGDLSDNVVCRCRGNCWRPHCGGSCGKWVSRPCSIDDAEIVPDVSASSGCSSVDNSGDSPGYNYSDGDMSSPYVDAENKRILNPDGPKDWSLNAIIVESKSGGDRRFKPQNSGIDMVEIVGSESADPVAEVP